MSIQFFPNEASFSGLKDKVVVLTGGSNGIGASILKILHAAGANVVFGDTNETAADALLDSLSRPSNVTFVKTDVTSYASNINLFKTALQKHGRVDHGIPCAGVLEQGKWFDPELTVDTVEQQEPTTIVLDVNLKGVAYFARIAVVFMRHGMKTGENKSITLISSAAGFRASPGLFMYQCSKHGALGLMRTTRNIIYPRDGIRINVICPALTDTQMTASIIDMWRNANQEYNMPDDIGRATVALLTEESMNGKSIYVEGGRSWEFEESLDRTMPQWLGEGPARRLKEGLRAVGQGDGWKIK